MAIEVFGIRITLDDASDPVTQDTDIGLYNVSGDNSVFRWLQNDVSGISNWKSGILAAGGISRYSKKVNVTLGGNVANLGGCTIRINNTSKIWNAIRAIPIYLTGKRIEIVYFNDGVEETQWRGVISGITWNRKIYTLSCSPTQDKRRTNIVREVNVTDGNEKAIQPATFGEWRDNYVAMSKISSTSKVMNNDEIDLEIFKYDISINNEELNTFPISNKGTAPTLDYRVRHGVGKSFSGTPVASTSMTDYFLKVVEDENDNKDSFRRITEIQPDVNNSGFFSVTLSTYFPTDLIDDDFSWTGSWVQIHKVNKSFSLDDWPCGGFVDENGTSISATTNFNVAVYDSNATVDTSGSVDTVQVTENDDTYLQLPGQSVEIRQDDSNKNTFNIVLSHFKDDSDKIEDYLILPVENVKGYTGTTESIGLNPAFYSYDDGVYYSRQTPTTSITRSGSASNVTDKNNSNSWEWSFTTPGDVLNEYFLILEFDFPALPDNVDFSNCYLLGNSIINSSMSDASSVTWQQYGYLSIRRFVGDGTLVLDGLNDGIISKTTIGSASQYVNINNIPSFYADGASTTNQQFYVNSTGQTLSGLSNASISQMSDINSYNLYKKGYFAFYTYAVNPLADVNHTVTWREFAIAIPRKLSIKKKIFTRTKGRTYNDTWENRKTSIDMINNPIDMMEHTCRLQNWADYDSTLPSGGWGRNYSAGARIKRGTLSIPYTASAGSFSSGESVTTSGGAVVTLIADEDPNLITFDLSGSISNGDHITGSTSGATATVDGDPADISDGSFDNRDLDALKALRPSRQISTESEGWTDKIKKSICRDFFLINYVDKDGRECINELRKTASSDTLPIVSLADIRKANSDIKITEPNVKDVFVEPYVRYNYDPGSKKYKDIIAVKNVAATTYNADDTLNSGYIEDSAGVLSSGSAEHYWNICHSLWFKFGVINEPPRDLSECKWSGGIDSNASAIAQNKLERWIEWQGNRTINFSIHFSHLSNGVYARDWNEGEHFLLDLPHETNGVQVECIATSIAVSPNPPYNIDVDAILLEEGDIVTEYNIQDVMYTEAEGAGGDWEDSTDESNPQIQDTM